MFLLFEDYRMFIVVEKTWYAGCVAVKLLGSCTEGQNSGPDCLLSNKCKIVCERLGIYHECGSLVVPGTERGV